MSRGNASAYPETAYYDGQPTHMVGGLTIREYFAAMAMQALIHVGNANGRIVLDEGRRQRRQTLHEMAVEHADRQLDALAKAQP